MISEGYRASAHAAEPVLRRRGPMPARLYVVAIQSLIRLGRLTEAFTLLERAQAELGAGGTDGSAQGEVHLLQHTIEAQLWAGRLHEAEAVAGPALRTAVIDDDPIAAAFVATALSQCQLEQGRPRSAAASGRQALQVFQIYGTVLLSREAGWTTAVALAVTGDARDAANVLAQTKERPGDMAIDAPRELEVNGWITATSGDLRGARRLLDQAADALIRVGDLQHAATALHSIARLGYPEIAEDRMIGLATEMDGELAPARAAHASALAAHDAHVLERIAHQFQTMGADLYAAEAQAAAAVEHRRAGRARDAAAAARRAGVLAARCEGATTPALQDIEARSQLTPAEVETASLAAAGYTNREIANALLVSVRTVENRLYRIYEKLGVSGRDALAQALRPPEES
jgi:DNA-binding CsgD family transcriptional regulator